MPLPIAHGMVGASLVALIHPSAGIKNWKPMFWGFLLANSPDLDFAFAFLFGWKNFHRGISHSLVFALAVAALIFVFLRRKHWRIPFSCALAFLSHTLLDFISASDGAVRLLTPFDNDKYALGWFGFSELTRGLIISDMLRFSVIEALIFVPVFFIMLVAKKFS
jgi:membrane-bound metal-dependent hydrolase YbcI (DUF457 family)